MVLNCGFVRFVLIRIGWMGRRVVGWGRRKGARTEADKTKVLFLKQCLKKLRMKKKICIHIFKNQQIMIENT